ncbi:Lysophospholipase L1 [Amycolatopsis marina]|uniref:Lysophospholipase L1 n=1 Tax=Amycolatopsis marina TaxID=490629 RepID=A0A1I0VAT7_9PSEU|nr:SGNH/GDSL hydrolase family protein [Amycolatopsis marina]SFA72706.1 Lysophospholipase L1 [Amycolatopsis marina]
MISSARPLLATAATVLLAPALLIQGRRVRRTTPRLPDAAGPTGGGTGAGSPLDLLVLGESTVAGVGARDHEEALTGQLASALAERSGRAVRWRALGRSGADARTVHAELLESACERRADLVVIALGVNDTVGLHGATRYRQDLLRLIGALRARLGAPPVLLAGVPPMSRFPTLPQPLRAVLGIRSRVLDSAAAELAALPGVLHAPMPAALLDPDSFADDGFHPGPAGYRIWAEQLAALAPIEQLRPVRPPS